MKNRGTLFYRLLIINILIVIVSLFITGSIMFYSFGKFIINDKSDDLFESTEQVYQLYSLYYNQINDNSIPSSYTNKTFKTTLDFYSSTLKSLIWIVDEDGYIIYPDAFSFPESVRNEFEIANNRIKLPKSDQYSFISKEEGEMESVGDFYGIFKLPYFYSSSNIWLTVGKAYVLPNTYNNISNNIGIYFHSPIPEVYSARTMLFRLFLLASCISAFISILVINIFSYKLSRPIKEMARVAEKISSGDFTQRISINQQGEIGQLGKSFNHMVENLEELEKMRSDFIANISHELRTPMTSIKGFVDGILDGTISDDKQNHYLNIVSEETARLARLVDNLLILERMNNKDITLKFSIFDINESFRKSIIGFEKLIVEKKIHIKAKFECEKTFVQGEKDAIDRVIYNLVHNAVKFTPENGTIEIGTYIKKNIVYSYIHDSGEGISKEDLAHIWDRFYMSDKSRKKDGGTGLGLSIVKNILKLHEQEIEITTSNEDGTKFEFTLKYIDKKI